MTVPFVQTGKSDRRRPCRSRGGPASPSCNASTVDDPSQICQSPRQHGIKYDSVSSRKIWPSCVPSQSPPPAAGIIAVTGVPGKPCPACQSGFRLFPVQSDCNRCRRWFAGTKHRHSVFIHACRPIAGTLSSASPFRGGEMNAAAVAQNRHTAHRPTCLPTAPFHRGRRITDETKFCTAKPPSAAAYTRSNPSRDSPTNKCFAALQTHVDAVRSHRPPAPWANRLGNPSPRPQNMHRLRPQLHQAAARRAQPEIAFTVFTERANIIRPTFLAQHDRLKTVVFKTK